MLGVGQLFSSLFSLCCFFFLFFSRSLLGGGGGGGGEQLLEGLFLSFFFFIGYFCFCCFSVCSNAAIMLCFPVVMITSIQKSDPFSFPEKNLLCPS